MVTTRDSSSFADLQKAKSKEWFQKFGRSDITWNVKTTTVGVDGRTKTNTTSSTTISGDLQFDVKLLSSYVQLGIAKTGDGIFYTLPSYGISANDEIVVDSITWRLVQQIEAEQTTGITIYQGWICRRNP